MMVISAYSDDVFGHMLIDILKQNSVNAKGCLFDQHTRTKLAFVTHKSNSEQEFMFLIEAELNLDLIRRDRIFHYGSLSCVEGASKFSRLSRSLQHAT
jgi:fructokinase